MCDTSSSSKPQLDNIDLELRPAEVEFRLDEDARSLVVDLDTKILEGYRLLLPKSEFPPIYVAFCDHIHTIIILDDGEKTPNVLQSNTQTARIRVMDEAEAKLIFDFEG